MACKYHPEYNPTTGEIIGKVKDFGSTSSAKVGMYTYSPCGYCLQDRVRYLKTKLDVNEDILDTQIENNKSFSLRQLKDIKELKKRVLDEQGAFDKMEELYLKERENVRVLEKSSEITQESIERDSVNFNLSLDEAEEREKVWYERYQDRFEKESRCREEVRRLKDRNEELNGAFAEENDFGVKLEAEAIGLRTTLKEVLFQFEGLVQFVSEDDYLDDELETLFVDILKEARKRLEGKN